MGQRGKRIDFRTQRRIAKLNANAGLSLREIAKDVNVAVNTVRRYATANGPASEKAKSELREIVSLLRELTDTVERLLLAA